jgi:hypothetical protein
LNRPFHTTGQLHDRSWNYGSTVPSEPSCWATLDADELGVEDYMGDVKQLEDERIAHLIPDK